MTLLHILLVINVLILGLMSIVWLVGRLHPNPSRTAKYSVEEVIAKIRDHNLPECLITIAQGNCPEPLSYTCQVINPIKCQFTDDFIPLWETNSDSVLGFEPSTSRYLHYSYEDEGPAEDHEEEAFSNFPQVCAWLLFSFADSGFSDVDLKRMSEFLGFSYFDVFIANLKRMNDENFEQIEKEFIASLD